MWTNNFKKVFKTPFFYLLLLFIISAKGHLEIIDTEYSLRTARSIVEDGTMLIEPVCEENLNHRFEINGVDKIYSQYGVGILMIFVPIVIVGKFIAYLTSINEILITHFFISFYNIPFAILGLYHFREILRALGQNKNISNFLMISMAFGTIFWKYTVTDFSEITQIALILGAIHSYLCRKNENRWFKVSFYLGLLILLKIAYLILLPPFIGLAIYEGWQTQKTKVYLLQGASFLLPIGLLLMYANWARFGSVYQSGYGNQQFAFSLDYLKRDWFDYVFSIDRGILAYSPILLMTPLFIKRFLKKDKSLFLLIFFISISIYLLTASWIGWKGGFCWGNRNLVPIVPLLCISWAFIDWKNLMHKLTFLILLTLSTFIQLIGVSLKSHEWSVISREFKDHPDPYYVPTQLEGSSRLFIEKMSNSSGVYQANIFVKEHHHIIDLQKYESFTGFNFWLVHLLKYINFSTHIRFTGNTILIILGSGVCFMLHRFQTSSQKI